MIYFSLTPNPSLRPARICFWVHKCPTLPSEILQPVLGFCFFSNLTKFQFKTHSGCNNSQKHKEKIQNINKIHFVAFNENNIAGGGTNLI